MSYNQNYNQYDQYGQPYQDYQGYPGQQGQYAQQGQQYPAGEQPTLLAGRFDAKKVAVNLVIFGILAAAVTFAAVFVVDLLVGMIPDEVSGGVGTAVMAGVVAGVIGVMVGLLYIPVSGTGNEHLFGLAVIALAVVAAVAWVLAAGLLNGEWRTLVTLTGIICTAAVAYATPARIEAAAVR
ncbi:MAG TPA: hypothetical protein H9867_02665 [Candidatus Corynebacterium gallistercoris]|uniref:Uncharacterized protein n=1 Tax=Candidatus Corynebacterium gallistercoris TaxID=2838530 RepID=A0A9D1RZ54_9CORY|nr:hypothetical protein [Candidatus Corynebacterium gallistercoris]